MSRRSFAVEKWMRQRHALAKAEAKFGDSKISLPVVLVSVNNPQS